MPLAEAKTGCRDVAPAAWDVYGSPRLDDRPGRSDRGQIGGCPRSDGLAERSSAYRSLIVETMSDDAIEEIRTYLQQQRALGGSAFQRRVEQQL